MARPTHSFEALVVKHTKLKEVDTIVTLLVSDGTKRAAVARGLRKPGSRFGGRLEQFCVIQAFCTQGSKLDTINDAKLLKPHLNLRTHALERSYAAMVICDYASRISYEHLPEPYLYQMTVKALETLETLPHDDRLATQSCLLVAAYLIKASALMGWYPCVDHCASCGKALPLDPSAPSSIWWFNAREGGCVCNDCITVQGELKAWDTNTLSWLVFLLNAPFSQIVEHHLPIEVSHNLLDLCFDWIQAQVELSLTSVKDLINLSSIT